jgi:hypothetical protein
LNLSSEKPVYQVRNRFKSLLFQMQLLYRYSWVGSPSKRAAEFGKVPFWVQEAAGGGGAVGLYTLNQVALVAALLALVASLQAPGFNRCASNVKSWFQSLLCF